MNKKKSLLNDPDSNVRLDTEGRLAVITLDRQDALNALSLEMVRTLSAMLNDIENDNKIDRVLIKGAGTKAFCAGGDLKAVYKVGMDFRRGHTNIKVPTVFFTEEYALNKKIYNFSKPIISFMNGIVMGGGYGIGGNSRYRVVTEKTVFAMPEVAIGFFPDVASMFHLHKFKDHIGRYVALTGNRLDGDDAHYAGVGEYFMPVHSKRELIEQLSGKGKIEDILNSFSVSSDQTAPMSGQAARIKTVFAHESVSEILKALEDDGTAWAAEVFEILHERSPSSVYVTAEYMRRTKDRTVDEILDMDLALAVEFIQRSDLYEGIHATVIDRGALPSWDPEVLKKVSEEYVNEYFRPAT